MYYKVFLACALVTAVSGQSVSTSTTRRPSITNGMQNTLDRMRDSTKAAIGMFNSTAQTATNVVNDGVQGLTSAGKIMVNTGSSIKSSALQGGVTTFKQGVDIAANLAGILPGIGGIASVGGGMVKAGADVGNMMGQTGIGLGNGIANGKLQLVSSMSNVGAGLAKNGINMAATMANKGVDTGHGMASSAAASIGNAMDNSMNYVNQVSNKMSSMASSTADRMSFSAAALPSMQKVGIQTVF